MPCRVLNPTDKTVKLKAGTVIGKLSPVHVYPMVATVSERPTDITVSIEDMRKALEAKKLSLDGVVLKGGDLDNLIRLLYNNIDLFATSFADLPGCDVLLHRIDTGDSPPVHKRAYRHTPADREEISR
jgi:hypothetical protein